MKRSSSAFQRKKWTRNVDKQFLVNKLHIPSGAVEWKNLNRRRIRTQEKVQRLSISACVNSWNKWLLRWAPSYRDCCCNWNLFLTWNEIGIKKLFRQGFVVKECRRALFLLLGFDLKKFCFLHEGGSESHYFGFRPSIKCIKWMKNKTIIIKGSARSGESDLRQNYYDAENLRIIHSLFN